ncbi:hypothetical protein [Streptomyces sp. NPDC002788]
MAEDVGTAELSEAGTARAGRTGLRPTGLAASGSGWSERAVVRAVVPPMPVLPPCGARAAALPRVPALAGGGHGQDQVRPTASAGMRQGVTTDSVVTP